MAANPFLNQAQQLFDIYATGFDPGQQGLEFWSNKFAAPNADPEAIRREFLNPAQGAAAPRYSALMADPDYLAAIGKGPTAPTTQAQNLFSTYATGFDPGKQGIDFWSQQIEQKGYENALADFLNPEQGAAAPRYSAMQADPDYANAVKQARDTEYFRQATGQVGEGNRLELDQELRNWYNKYTGGQGMANPIEDYISMLSGRDTTNLQQDYKAAKQRMLRDAQLAGLYGGDVTGTIAYDSWARQQDPKERARQLFSTYATGMTPDQEAIDFWASRFADPRSTEQSVLNEFLNPRNKQAERITTMEADPAYQMAKGLLSLPGSRTTVANEQVLSDLQKKATPTTEGLGPGAKEIVDRNFEGDADLARDAAEAAAKVTPGTVGQRTETDTKKDVDTSNFPKFEGTPYDPAAYDNVLKQLTAQQKALESRGVKYVSSFGGAEQTLQDMAKRLAAMGISDIRDFGQKFQVAVEKEEPYLMYQDEGAPIQVDTGKYRTIDGIEGYTAENEPIYKYRYLTDDEVKKLKQDNSGNLSLVLDQSDLPNDPYASTLYYNKKTGEILDSRKFGSKAESGIWASSGAGDGFTDYRVMYTKEGIPVFVPQKQFSGMKEFITEDLQGILSVLRFLPGAQIPVMVAQAAAAAYMGADPKDIARQIGTSLIASNLGNIAGNVMKEFDITPPITPQGQMALQGGLGALSSLIQGGNLEQALRSGALTAAGTGISGLLPKGDGTFNYEKIIQALAPAIARGELSNADAFRLINALVVPTKKKEPGKP